MTTQVQLKVQLKKPIGVFALAILFLLAPLGNLVISFMGSGIVNWYEPNIFVSLLKTVTAFDWLWLGLLSVTGVLLFRPHKTTWSLAILLLIFVLGLNAYRVFNVDPNSIDPHFLRVFSIMAVVSTLSVLVVALYFRFPYLDRRAKWTSDEQNPDRRSGEREDKSDRRKS